MADCTELVISLARDRNIDIPNEELELVIKNMSAQLKRRKITSPDDLNSALDVSMQQATEMRLTARQLKREALLRIIKKNNIEAKIDAFDGDAASAYSTQMMGESKLRTGSRDSASARKSALERNFVGSFLRRLVGKNPALEDIMRKGKIDREVYLYAYDRNARVSAEAKQIHDIIFSHMNGQRERKNRAGAFIGEREDFLVSQSHNPQLISKTPIDQWKSDIRRLLDEEATFGKFNSEQEIDEYLTELYKRFSTGKHYLVDDSTGDISGKPSSANLAKKLSQSRTLHFKDGQSAFEYSQKYSGESLWDKVIESARSDARSITMLEMYGTNPKAMHDAIMRTVEQKAFKTGKLVDQARIYQLNAEFNALNGSLDVPGNVTLAQVGFGLRALQNMSKLGGAVISAFSDVVFKGATLNRRTDLGFFGAYGKSFDGMLNNVGSKDKKHVAAMTNIYAETVLGQAFTRAGSIDGMPGTISKMQELFFRWNLLQGWTVNHKKGVATAMAFDLGRYRNTAFDQLPEKTKRNLEMYNISAEEWSVVSKMETLAPGTTDHFVTPDAVMGLTNDVIDPIISRLRNTTDVTDNMRASFKDEFSTKIQTLLSDIADEAVITPGERERVLLTFGTQKGTYHGEFFRFLTQFKTFPVTVITKQLMPEYFAAGGGVKGFAALVPLIAATTVLGYLSGEAKDIIRGREPKDPKAANTWKEALLRGGGLGIYGDFLFGEYSRYGRSFEETLAGPSIGFVGDALALAHKSATLNADAKDYFKFIKDNAPFSNLFYTEQAMNYMFFYGMMEMADPGFLSRMEKKRLKDYNQEYWLPPSTSAVQF